MSNDNNFKDLVSFRLNMLANIWSRLAAEQNAQMFDIDPREWRIIGMLGAEAPMSLLALAKEIHVDKSQASRSVTALVERNLVERASDEKDGRGVQLSLTRQGKALYRKIFPSAVKRNEQLLSVLSAEERDSLESMLLRLTAHAQQSLESSRERSR